MAQVVHEHPGFSDAEQEWFEEMVAVIEHDEELVLFGAFYRKMPVALVVKLVDAAPGMYANRYWFRAYAMMLTPSMLAEMTDMTGRPLTESLSQPKPKSR